MHYTTWVSLWVLQGGSEPGTTPSYLASILELKAKLHRVYAAILAEVKSGCVMLTNGAKTRPLSVPTFLYVFK